MSRYEIKEQAREDLREIALHIGQDSPEIAVAFIDELLARIAWVADNPKLHRARFELDGNVRIAAYAKYYIVYHVGDEAVEIVRVVHSSRNLEAVMDDVR